MNLRVKYFVLLLGLWMMPLVPGQAAILYLEEFTNVTSNGWGDRDAGEMTVSHDTGNDWMEGSFGTSFFSQTDAFRISTGTDFLGDYVTPGLTQISFDLNAVNVLPSDLFIRIIDGANIFSYQFTPINSLNTFQTYTVNLTWSFGWLGSSEAAFNAALGSVDAIEIQITRNGSSAQTYYLDNVETLDTDIGDPGGGSAIPEPSTLNQMLLTAILLCASFRVSRRLKPTTS